MKKFVKLAVVFCALCALCACMCVGVSATTVVASGTFGADGDNLTWELDDEGTLTIGGEGAMNGVITKKRCLGITITMKSIL